MSIFKRLFNMGSAEAHSALDKLENPIKMTEQGIRNLKTDLSKSIESLAEVKAGYIRAQREYNESKNKAQEYESKAILLLKKAETGNIDVGKAESLATEALSRKEQAMEHASTHQKLVDTQKAAVQKMETNINQLRSQIGKWENEAKILKARSKVSTASTKLNKQLANIDSSSTVSMLERMREKVDQQEALSESYGSMVDSPTSLDDEINLAISGRPTSNTSSSLEALKQKLALDNKKEE